MKATIAVLFFAIVGMAAMSADAGKPKTTRRRVGRRRQQQRQQQRLDKRGVNEILVNEILKEWKEWKEGKGKEEGKEVSAEQSRPTVHIQYCRLLDLGPGFGCRGVIRKRSLVKIPAPPELLIEVLLRALRDTAEQKKACETEGQRIQTDTVSARPHLREYLKSYKNEIYVNILSKNKYEQVVKALKRTIKALKHSPEYSAETLQGQQPETLRRLRQELYGRDYCTDEYEDEGAEDISESLYRKTNYRTDVVEYLAGDARPARRLWIPAGLAGLTMVSIAAIALLFRILKSREKQTENKN